MKTTRRQLLKGSVTGAAALALPSPAFSIPDLTDACTLTSLAAAGRFASSPLKIPTDVHSAKFRFLLNGQEFRPDSPSIVEIYAPGDDTGWAVVYIDNEVPFTGGTELIRGDWRIYRA